MKRGLWLFLCSLGLACFPPLSSGKELPKIAVWDLQSQNTPESHARQLTSFMVSEITKLKKYEVYSQENVRTLAGWTAQQMQLGCTDKKCLTALGQIDIAKLISGSVGKIGNRYTVSLNLFDTQNSRAENALSKACQSEDELIELIQASVRELLGESSIAQLPATAKPPEVPVTDRTAPSPPETRTALADYRDPVTGMEFVLVKGGCFQMGDTFGDGNADERPMHEVCLKDFYLGKYEVTQRQWKRVMGANPPIFTGQDDHPVDNVSWNDVQEFIRRLNQMSGKNYRLPTEAEWEYAARSGGKRERWAGTNAESELHAYAWVNVPNNTGQGTQPVGQKRPNGLGLYDMTGNAWEWVSDWYHKDYYRDSPRNDPAGLGRGQLKTLRGGSWGRTPVGARNTTRHGYAPTENFYPSGFRLGVSAP